MPTKQPTVFEALWPRVLNGETRIEMTMAEFNAAVAEAERLESLPDPEVEPGTSAELRHMYRNMDIILTDR